MYFVISGTIGIGYNSFKKPQGKARFHITLQLDECNFFGDYYIINNTTSEFIYMVIEEMEAFSLGKDFLMREVLPKFPGLHK